ncbi:MAG: YfhO family protein [Candidatus Sumerlaeaceae bacterium]|nr:YfhO family protein [Candidatus Sumerlaeaceae bacterium]
MSRIRPYLISILLTALFYAPLFKPGNSFLMGDYFDYYMPVRYHANKALQEGRLPEFTNALYGGMPFLSDPETAVFYPPHLLFAWISRETSDRGAMDALVMAHLFLLALGATFLGRSLGLGEAGAVTFAMVAAFNGFMVRHLGHIGIFEPLTMGLWALGAMARAVRHTDIRWAAGSGLLFACALLGGHPQAGFMLCLAAAAGGAAMAIQSARSQRSWALLWKLAGIGLLIAFLAGAGAAIQLIPTIQFLDLSTRRALPLSQALSFPLPLRALPGLVFPGLFEPLPWRLPDGHWWSFASPNWCFIGAWEYMYPVGLMTFALAAVGALANWRSGLVRWLAAGSLVVVLLALGERGLIYPILYDRFDFIRQMRIPARLLWLAITAWGLLAGLGMDSLCGRGDPARARRAALWTATAIAGILLMGDVVIGFAHAYYGDWYRAFHKLFVSDPFFQPGVTRGINELVADIGQQIALAHLIALLCIGLLVCASRLGPARWIGAMAGLLLFGELCLHGFHKNIAPIDPANRSVVAPFLRALNGTEVGGRVLYAEAGPWEINTALATPYSFAGGYGSIHFPWMEELLPETMHFGNGRQEKLLDLWNVSHVVFRSNRKSIPLDGQVTHLPDYQWIELGSGDHFLPEKAEWPLQPSLEAKRIRTFTFATGALALPDGYPMASVVAYGPAGDVVSSQPLRLGLETAEGGYGDPLRAKGAGHRKLPAAFRPDIKPVTGVFEPPNPEVYMGTFDFPSSASVARIAVEATGAPGLRLGLTHILVESSQGRKSLSGIQGLGYTQTKSGYEGWRVMKRPYTPAYARLVPTALISDYQKSAEVRRQLLAEDFEASRTVILKETEKLRGKLSEFNAADPARFEGSVQTRTVENGDVSIRTKSNQPGWLVVSLTHYPGWMGFVDGTPKPVYWANGLQLAMAVPAGEHEIRMVFATPGLAVGACLSAVAWFWGIVLLLRRRKTDANPVGAN